ncbi:MAG: type I glyceraldehyde-3-phosphate dehydrogenase [Acidobacteriota bacterium]
MPIPFAINGLGRIGRALARIAHRRPELDLVAVNDIASAADLARLLARDSVHGRFDASVESSIDGEQEALIVDGRRLPVFHAVDPQDIPWPADVAVVVEATGTATERARAAEHRRQDGTPPRVVVSAIADDADVMLCPGLDDGRFDPEQHRIVSTASCTTHCLALLVDVLHRAFDLRHVMMSEVHGYTANQRLVDGPHADPRRGRAAAVNIVPTSTAAPRAVERILPELRGRVRGMAVRVPTPNVAFLDVVASLATPTSADAVRAAFRDAAEGRLSGWLAVSDEPLVSSDHIGDPHSAIVDLPLVDVLADPDGDTLVRVQAWYDNEWGYAHRLADVLTAIGEKP